jgi:IclR family pca regulon transcriptional regulator
MCSVPLAPLTPHTVTDLERLHQLLRACREQGYAACDEEIEPGVRSIAVPIVNEAGRTIAAMSISTRADRMTIREMATQYLPALLRNQAWARTRVD